MGTATSTRAEALRRDERRLRVERAQTIKKFRHKREGTPETHAHAGRQHQGAIARLFQTGAIDAVQLGSAVDIAAVAEAIGRDVTIATASLETRIDRARAGGQFYEALGAVRREIAYTRWRHAIVRSGAPIAAVLDMLTGETIAFTEAARRHRMSHRRARRLLIEALDLWPTILAPVCREIAREDLDRAHARLNG